MRVIRPLHEKDDFEAVGGMLVSSWRQSYGGILPREWLNRLSPQRFCPALRAAPERSLVLFEDDIPVGICTVGFSREPGREGWGEIISLYLLKEHQGRGHGRRLLTSAMACLNQEGCEKVCLWVFADNPGAIRFYEHMGFALSGNRQREPFSSAMVELLEMTCTMEGFGLAENAGM